MSPLKLRERRSSNTSLVDESTQPQETDKQLDHEELLELVSSDLEWLTPPPVFVGSTVVAIQLDEFGKSQMRPTQDVDCIVPSIDERMKYGVFEKNLRDRGWRNDMRPGSPMFRYFSPSNCLVDLIPDVRKHPEFTNRWFVNALNSPTKYKLPSGREIYVPTPDVLLATKLEAFFKRGAENPVMSKDLEDIATLLESCMSLERHITQAKPDVSDYIRDSFRIIRNKKRFWEVLFGNLTPSDSGGRIEFVRDLIDRLTET